MRVIDEETLAMVDAEFLIKQETKNSKYLRESMFQTQLIRTTEKVKIGQLKKLIKSKLDRNANVTLSDMDFFIYKLDVNYFIRANNLGP